MLTVEIEAPGARQLLQDMQERLNNPTGLRRIMGDLLVDYEREVFATRGFGRWAADDPVTARLKGNGRVLVDTGALFDNLTTVNDVDEDTVSVNQGDAFWGRFLRDGDRGMPRRDPAPKPSEATVSGWGQRILDYLIEGRR